MDTKNIDFLRQLAPPGERRVSFDHLAQPKRRHGRKKFLGVIIAFVIITSVTYAAKVVVSSSSLAQSMGGTSVFEQIRHLVGAGDKVIAGETDGRINVLLLGIGGENHQGGQLTDTIIVASIDPKTKRIGLLSIPRDLVVPIPGMGWQKINSAHAYGLKRGAGGGINLAKETIEGITGLDINYYVKADFSGFEKIVDALGGVRVYVNQSFTDNQYPDENFGYEPVHFEAGWQNMDGAAALKYARSRHGTGGEGSDFARASRQQEVLRALQARSLALSTLLNPGKVLALTDIVSSHIETDMELWESLKLFDMVKKVTQDNISEVVLSVKDNGLLVTDTNEEGAYLLRPRAGAGNFDEVKTVAEHLLDGDPYLALASGSPAVPPKQQVAGIKIVVQNGTNHPGLAAQTADELRSLAYYIAEVGNAPVREYEKTVIYQLTDKDISSDVARIRETLGANVSPSLPEFMEPNQTNADLLIIVGEDGLDG